MVDVEIKDSKLILRVEGMDQLWALKSHLEIPLEHISGVRVDPQIVHPWLKGIKEMGSDIPGVIKAGTFYEHGEQVFWDVHHPEKTIVIELLDEKYKELIIEVENPESIAEMVRQSIR